MELTLDGTPTLQAEGSVTIELPAYFRLLNEQELEEAKTADNRGELILACGRHPNGDIVFLTGDGQLWELDVETQRYEGLPSIEIDVFPTDYGNTIAYVDSYEVDAGWALARSRRLLNTTNT